MRKTSIFLFNYHLTLIFSYWYYSCYIWLFERGLIWFFFSYYQGTLLNCINECSASICYYDCMVFVLPLVNVMDMYKLPWCWTLMFTESPLWVTTAYYSWDIAGNYWLILSFHIYIHEHSCFLGLLNTSIVTEETWKIIKGLPLEKSSGTVGSQLHLI